MKQLLKKCLSLTALLSIAAISADSCSSSCSTSCSTTKSDCAPTTRVTFRSQGRNRVIQDVLTDGLIYLPDMESWYGYAAITPAYERSFRSGKIANCLFGPSFSTVSTGTTISTTSNSCSSSCETSCDSRTILVQGSTVANRNSSAWLADYFYLPSDYDGSFTVKPRITNVNVNFDFFIGFKGWCDTDLYFRVYGPFTHTSWDLNLCETVVSTGTIAPIPGQLVSTSTIAVLDSFGAYASGARPLDTDSVTFRGLEHARLLKCKETKNGFADLRAELGWLIWNCEDYRFGIDIEFAAPTGNKVKDCNLFAPQIGNDHWELGGGVNAFYNLWRCDDESMSFDFNFDVHITHMFKAKQTRTFDLANNPFSRYILAAQVGTNSQSLQQFPATTPATLSRSQFANVYSPVANLTSRDVKVSIGAQADLVAWFTFMWCGFSVDLGYNFWGRSCEKIHDLSCATTKCGDKVAAGNWILVDPYVDPMYGYAAAGGTLTAGTPVALSPSHSNATITAAGAMDGRTAAGAGDTAAAVNYESATGAQAFTSIQPVPFAGDSVNILDIDGSKTRGISHKIFGSFNYTFERDCWSPFIGIGASGEFGSNSCSSKCNTTADTTATVASAASCKDSKCKECSLSQWSVFVKLGVAFN